MVAALGETAAEKHLVPVLTIFDDHECGIGWYPAEIFREHTHFVHVAGTIEMQVEIEGLGLKRLMGECHLAIDEHGDTVSVDLSIVIEAETHRIGFHQEDLIDNGLAFEEGSFDLLFGSAAMGSGGGAENDGFGGVG